MPFFSILPLLSEPVRIKVIDVGAMELGGSHDPYHRLTELGIADVVGFEPVRAECDKRNANAPPGQTFLPYFIGDGGEGTFHECNFPMTSSLYPPNTALLDKFQQLEEVTRVVRTERVRTQRLDDIPEVADADWLKMDVQGAELQVIKGAQRVLRETVMVQSEVEFVPLYLGQPLFAEIDQAMRRAGFSFHHFAGGGFGSRLFKPFLRRNGEIDPANQYIWAEAVYVKDFMQLHRLSTGKLLKLAVILHEVQESYDLCALILEEYDRKAGARLRERYMRVLLGQEPVPQATA